jgi:hypothetical protein
MLSVGQRLVGLHLLYECYLHENVKTTPFYPLVLNLLQQPDGLHPAERRLLTAYLNSVPKIAKLTPAEYIQETEKTPPDSLSCDFEPYRKAHAGHMPQTSPYCAAALTPVLRDNELSSAPFLQYLALLRVGLRVRWDFRPTSSSSRSICPLRCAPSLTPTRATS